MRFTPDPRQFLSHPPVPIVIGQRQGLRIAQGVCATRKNPMSGPASRDGESIAPKCHAFEERFSACVWTRRRLHDLLNDFPLGKLAMLDDGFGGGRASP